MPPPPLPPRHPSQTVQASAQHRSDIQDIEIHDYLRRERKNLSSFSFESPLRPPFRLPESSTYKNPQTGALQLRPYVKDVFTAVADEYLPSDFFTPLYDSDDSLSKSISYAERVYVILPVFLEKVQNGKFYHIYRWDDPLRTAKYAIVYMICWYHDFVPGVLLLLFVWSLIKRRYFPEPSQEAEALQTRKETSKDAEIVLNEASNVSMSSATPHDNDKDEGKDQEGNEDEKKKDIFDTIFAKSKDTKALYDFMILTGKQFGPHARLILFDAADGTEKVKNLFLWRRPNATWRTIGVLLGMIVALTFVPPSFIIRSLFLWLGIQYFVLFPIQDALPRYRRVFNPIWWLLYDVPNDEDSILDVLKNRQPFKSSAPSMPTHRRSSSSSSVTSTSSVNGKSTQKKQLHMATFGKTPGQIVIEDGKLQFKTISTWKKVSAGIDRFTGASISCDIQVSLMDITQIKKEDSGVMNYNKSLIVCRKGGNPLRFSNISGRDDLFNEIATTS